MTERGAQQKNDPFATGRSPGARSEESCVIVARMTTQTAKRPATQTAKRTVAALLALHPRSHAEELGIDIASGRPRALARWLFACIVAVGGGVRTGPAAEAARALHAGGLCIPDKLAIARVNAVARILRNAGCARFDEQVARSLVRTARALRDQYQGDLRALRAEAERDPKRERALLMRLQGIGATGADMFLREAQAAWVELRPYADARVLAGAQRRDLPSAPTALAKLVKPEAFHRVAAALVREAQTRITARADVG